jgi:hypothetical protein
MRVSSAGVEAERQRSQCPQRREAVTTGAGRVEPVRRRLSFVVEADKRSMELLLFALHETWFGWVLRRAFTRMLESLVMRAAMGEAVEFRVVSGEVSR